MRRRPNHIAWWITGVVSCLVVPFAIAAEKGDVAEPSILMLDNGRIKIGVKKTSGAGIAWFSTSDSKQNIINHYDHGRLIQQSYYGRKDGSKWADKPWRWNPVQGGDYRGKPSKVIELKSSRNEIFSKTQPLHWATGQAITDMMMEQRISLHGEMAHIRFKMTYTGNQEHPPHHQEVPAVFVDRRFGTLRLYKGDQPWKNKPAATIQPKQRNEYHRISEHWAAYVDDNGLGMGVLVPIAGEITAYRVAKPGEQGACSYFAPIVTFGIKPNQVFQYDVFLTIGKTEEIRQRFRKVISARNAPE